MNEIFKRVSTRNFTSEKISENDINILLKAGMQAPSAGNQMPWEFLVVTKKEEIENLATFSKYANALKTATLAIIVLAKQDKDLKFPESKYQDLSSATTNILLQATALNLGSVWLGVNPFDDRNKFIKNQFNIPDEIEAFSVICLGHSNAIKDQTSRFDKDRVHMNIY